MISVRPLPVYIMEILGAHYIGGDIGSIFRPRNLGKVPGNHFPRLFKLLLGTGATAAHPFLVVRYFSLPVTLIQQFPIDPAPGGVKSVPSLRDSPRADAPFVEMDFRNSVSLQNGASPGKQLWVSTRGISSAIDCQSGGRTGRPGGGNSSIHQGSSSGQITFGSKYTEAHDSQFRNPPSSH